MSNDYTQTLPPVPKSYIHMGLHVWNERNLRDYGHACAEHARAPLLDQLGQCFRLSGADPDGNENWRLAPRAVDAVRQLRTDYDGACDENAQLLARIAELEEERDRVQKTLLDPDTVHVNMLRGTIAWIGWRRACHITGEVPNGEGYQLSEIVRLRAEVEARDAANAALRECLRECADDLEAEVKARASGELPRRIDRDLEPVRRAAALLAQPSTPWVNPLAAEVEAIRAKIDRAEVSYGNMLRADDKRIGGTTEYTRGWGNCLRAIIAARKGEGSEG